MIIRGEQLNFDTKLCYFNVKVDEYLITKYLKGFYRENKPRFKERFVKHFTELLIAYEYKELCYIINNIEYIWDKVNPFSYQEAFELKNRKFRAIVFSSIDIKEMIENLGVKRIKVEGKEMINKVWNPYKEEFDFVNYHIIYELHHVNGEKLGLGNEILPVVKCWCTTTNEEHWLWVNNDLFSDDSPLQAISSTCVIYESMVGKIKHIIRQGDVFIFEMKEDVVPSKNEKTLNLPMNEYFRLLKTQA